MDSAELNPRPQLSARRKLFYAALVYSAFLLLLFGVEIVTRLTQPHLSSLDLFVSTPQQRMQVVDGVQSTIFEGDPLLLWRLKPNLDHVIWDYTVLSTNAQGFRAEHPLEKKEPGSFRIVCLGDSVTFGYRVPVVWPEKPKGYVPEWLPFPMLLENELRRANPSRRVDVIDMAVPGYTSQQGLAWLRRDIDKLQPDLLVVSYGWNDASQSVLPDSVTMNTKWYAVATRWLVDHSQAFAHLTRWLRSRSQAKPQAVSLVSRVSASEYLANFDSIVSLARSRRVGVVVIGAPYRDSQTDPPEATIMTEYRRLLRHNMEQQHVPFLQILELTEEAGGVNSGFFGELIHPNHMGQRLIASELLKLMGREKMLSDLNVPNFVP